MLLSLYLVNVIIYFITMIRIVHFVLANFVSFKFIILSMSKYCLLEETIFN